MCVYILQYWDRRIRQDCIPSAVIGFNSLAPGGFENIFQNVFFKLISWIDTLSNSCETALRSMPQNPSDDKSTLVQVMAWCRQAASHYLSHCCPRSLSPYGVTRPQWVKSGMIKKPKYFLKIWRCYQKCDLNEIMEVGEYNMETGILITYDNAMDCSPWIWHTGRLVDR